MSLVGFDNVFGRKRQNRETDSGQLYRDHTCSLHICLAINLIREMVTCPLEYVFPTLIFARSPTKTGNSKEDTPQHPPTTVFSRVQNPLAVQKAVVGTRLLAESFSGSTELHSCHVLFCLSHCHFSSFQSVVGLEKSYSFFCARRHIPVWVRVQTTDHARSAKRDARRELRLERLREAAGLAAGAGHAAPPRRRGRDLRRRFGVASSAF